jgi:hypothetical protein
MIKIFVQLDEHEAKSKNKAHPVEKKSRSERHE